MKTIINYLRNTNFAGHLVIQQTVPQPAVLTLKR